MNLPADFIERTQSLLGKEWLDFRDALEQHAPVSIRTHRETISKSENIVPWCESGLYLDRRPSFTFDPLFHAGQYYVQEASSMFISQIIKQYADTNIRVLDLCAAPGGKSTLIADLLDEDSLLVSNEVIRSRANILSENIMKWGKANTIVSNNDPSQLGKLSGFFDIILVDAPCSGEGMFRKDPDSISEWSVANVKLCKERQQRILADIWPALKSGGILIYSTCTYNLDENESNVQWIANELGADILNVETQSEWGISPSFVDGVTAYRFFPHRTQGEGFFCAALRKTSEESEYRSSKKSKSNKNKKVKEDIPPQYKDYLLNKESFTFYPKGNAWNAFPSSLYQDLQAIAAHINVISEGICLGEMKGKDLIPDQSLALSDMLNTESFATVEVDWLSAIAYLRKEALVLDNQPKGYILLKYKGVPLGFVKNIGNRANNLYPQEWRIRSSNIPQEEVSVIV